MAEKAGELREPPTLRHYWNLYSVGKFQTLSQTRQYTIQQPWRRLGDLQDVPISLITIAELRDKVATEAKTYYPAKAMRTLLNQLYKLAGADGAASRELPSYIPLPQLHETPRTAFTLEEIRSLWTSYRSGKRFASIPLIMIHTGMMTGELRALRSDMIDLDKRQIIGAGMKTKVRRASSIYLSDSIIPVLQDVSAGKEGLLYPWDKRTFYKRYYLAIDEAGCRRLTPYCCRHTTATLLAVQGIAPQTIKTVMRWSSANMLDRYAHPSADNALDAVNIIAIKNKMY